MAMIQLPKPNSAWLHPDTPASAALRAVDPADGCLVLDGREAAACLPPAFMKYLVEPSRTVRAWSTPPKSACAGQPQQR